MEYLFKTLKRNIKPSIKLSRDKKEIKLEKICYNKIHLIKTITVLHNNWNRIA